MISEEEVLRMQNCVVNNIKRLDKIEDTFKGLKSLFKCLPQSVLDIEVASQTSFKDKLKTIMMWY